ncbi:MAG: site-specific integrase, partial [Pirellulales bacterium]|nr:site-specific integrase [Pirellulales bacterium]
TIMLQIWRRNRDKACQPVPDAASVRGGRGRKPAGNSGVAETELSIPLQHEAGRPLEPAMRATAHAEPTLHTVRGERKYLTAAERARFIAAAECQPPAVRLFCLLLLWSGGRLSEVLSVSANSFDLELGTVGLETLKRRKRGVVRYVPLPPDLIRDLDDVFLLRRRQLDSEGGHERLWSWSRTTAWRRLKEVMDAADISGPPASPKGLRHTFGVTAFQASVPPHLVQRWLGHASPRTTAIYGDVTGPEERQFARRMW